MGTRQIVVVGGSHGIGAGIVRKCLGVGAEVTTLCRTRGETAELAGVSHHPLDLASESIDQGTLPEVIDGFVYCPGTINLGPLRAVKAEQLRSDFELNVIGAVLSLQAAMKGLKRSGSASVVMFSTIAVGTGLPMHTSVAASKGAIEALTRTWAAELSPKIRVNAIAPGAILWPESGDTQENQEEIIRRTPLGRLGDPDDIAGTVLFLLRDAPFITGQVINVDGGRSAQP